MAFCAGVTCPPSDTRAPSGGSLFRNANRGVNMRRRILAWMLASTAVVLSACDDGPKQPYSVAPTGAGDRWNDGKTPGVADDAGAPFSTQMGGTNRQEICTGEQRH